MEMESRKPLFGRLAVEKGLITETQLTRALEIQQGESASGSGRLIGKILLEQGLLSDAQIDEILSLQEVRGNMEALLDPADERFASLALERGLVTVDQIFEAIAAQIKEELGEEKSSTIGAVLYALGYLTIAEIDSLLEAMGSGAHRGS